MGHVAVAVQGGAFVRRIFAQRRVVARVPDLPPCSVGWAEERDNAKTDASGLASHPHPRACCTYGSSRTLGIRAARLGREPSWNTLQTAKTTRGFAPRDHLVGPRLQGSGVPGRLRPLLNP